MNLPQGTEQTVEKPATEVYLDSLSRIYLVTDRADSVPENRVPRHVDVPELMASLELLSKEGRLRSVALYADSAVPYSAVVKVLDAASRSDIKMVLATHPVSIQ